MAIIGGVKIRYLRMLLVTIGLICILSTSPVTCSSLYTTADPIVQLTADNFFHTIKNTPNAWFIEFYAHWCGHCKRLAPTIKKLSHNVSHWGHVIKVGAIACSHAENVPICRRMQIRGYPTLRFLPPYLKSENYPGIDYAGASALRSLLSGMVDYVYQIRGKPRAWPIMDAVSSVQEILQRKPMEATTTFAIVENPSEKINENKALQLLFDLSGQPGLYAMRLRREDIPSGIYELQDDGTLVTILEGTSRNRLFRAAMRTVRAYRRQTSSTISTTTLGPPTLPSFSHLSTNGLHMQDLESSLYQSLWLEIGASYNITGNSLNALKAYVKVLVRYFPGNYYVSSFLRQLDTWLNEISDWITGDDWIEALNKIQSAGAYIPKRVRWTGCLGSQPSLRGYPCSLWQTFHALTVNALETNIRSEHYDSRDVLRVIRDYVRHFFSCRDCARHFAHMAQNMEREVRRSRDGVLWLWKAHNRVNKRLSGDATEDPRHPKTEFPSVAQCPTCRISHQGRPQRGRHQHATSDSSATQWNDDEVLIFLRRFYGKDFVIPDNLLYAVQLQTQRPPIYIPPETEFLDKAELTHGVHVKSETGYTTPSTRHYPSSSKIRHTSLRPTPERSSPLQPGSDLSSETARETETEEFESFQPLPLPITPVPQDPRPWTPFSRVARPWTPAPSGPQPWSPEPKQPEERSSGPPNERHNPPVLPGPAIRPRPSGPRPDYRPGPGSALRPGPAVRPQTTTLLPTSYDWHRPTRRPNVQPTYTNYSGYSGFSSRPTPVPHPGRSDPGGNCPEVTTDWSMCSTSCGSGVSTRMITKMPGCKTEMESRICQLRPCNYRFVSNQYSACGSTYRSANYLPLVFGECRSVHYLKWRYCGECPGKCCRPSISYTKELAFSCGNREETEQRNGEQLIAYANVEIIKLCVCEDC